jgi:hypothetical protein
LSDVIDVAAATKILSMIIYENMVRNLVNLNRVNFHREHRGLQEAIALLLLLLGGGGHFKFSNAYKKLGLPKQT